MGFLYIIRSLKSRQYYVGSSLDYELRLSQHNSGLSKATRGRGPWELVFVKEFESLREARQVEYKLKNKKSRKIIEQIVKDQMIRFLRE